MGKIIKARWDCAFCGTKGIEGDIQNCPNCGKSRDSNTKFYIDDPHDYVSEEEAKKINRNPDWHCSYCGSLNHDDKVECVNCGHTREESDQNYFELREKQEQKQRKRQQEQQKKNVKKIKNSNKKKSNQKKNSKNFVK